MNKLVFAFGIGALLCAGCVSDKGMYDGSLYGAVANEGGLYMGAIKRTVIPTNSYVNIIQYSEDTAFFSPSTKIRRFSLITSNEKVDDIKSIVDSIFKAEGLKDSEGNTALDVIRKDTRKDAKEGCEGGECVPNDDCKEGECEPK